MKAIIVARVSTEEQKEAGNSLPAQLTRMQNYCQHNNYTVAKTFSFDESAYKTKRDEFDKIIEFINQAKEKVAVCFDKVDRLSRNIFDKRVALLYEKAVSNEIELHFVSDSQVINDKMNAGDKFAFGMKLGLSKYYSDAISDNVKRAFEQKRRQGEWTGAVRLGYLNVSSDPEKRLRKDIIIDPERGYLIQKMFELYSTGNYSLETIRMKMIDLGLKTRNGNNQSKSGVENILKDSFYCGTAMSKTYGSYPHKYDRLISRELFDKCQAIRNGKRLRLRKFASKEFIFKGLATCAKCGCSMSPEIKTKKSGLTYIYYSCTNGKGNCHREYVPEKDLLKPVYDVFNAFTTIPEAVQAQVVNELRKTNESEIEYHKRQVERIRNDYARTQERIDAITNLLIDKSITKDVYDKKLQEFKDIQNKLNIEIEEYTKADYNYHIHVSTIINLSRRVKDIFESSEVPEKRALLQFLLQNPIVKDKKLQFELKTPFNLVLNLAQAQTKTATVSGNCPTSLGRWGSNPRPSR